MINVIKSGLIDLENEIKKMSEDEIKIERPHKIINIVKKILKLNQLKQQEGEGLKFLRPNQMLSRLPINLAQLKAGNNSEKLKNEIRQPLYSLYRSKKLIKQMCKSLIDIIQNMETIFMNTENNRTNKPHRFKLDLTDKLNLKDPEKTQL